MISSVLLAWRRVGMSRLAVLTWQDNSAAGNRRAEEKRPLPVAFVAGEDAGQPTESSAAPGAGLLPPEVQCVV